MRTPPLSRYRLFRYILLFIALLAVPVSSFAGVFISVNLAPPELPVYDQPLCPGDGYLWTPGYWAWDADVNDYYWVPGAWVLAPYTGALWTPGYWGWNDGAYLWNAGYWGLHIGFYGGVDYGFGYYGHGYEGGYWNHGAFTYNRTINHIGPGEHNVYERNIDHGPDNRVAFNGGNGGIHAEASSQERIAEHEQHIGAIPLQQQHQQAAAGNRAQFNGVNHGQPAVAATQRPGSQAFHQAMSHPDNPQAVQAAHNAPANNSRQAPANNDRPSPVNNSRPAPAANDHPAPAPQTGRGGFGEGQSHPQQPQSQPQVHTQAQPQVHSQPQSHPQPQSRPASQGGGGDHGHH